MDKDCVLCEVQSDISYVLFIIFVNVSLRKGFRIALMPQFSHVFSVKRSSSISSSSGGGGGSNCSMLERVW
jgi:uncharacterized membrane protein